MKIALTFDIESDNPNFLDTYFGLKVGLVKILKILDLIYGGIEHG